jgi:hypothetical protein
MTPPSQADLDRFRPQSSATQTATTLGIRSRPGIPRTTVAGVLRVMRERRRAQRR